jgi:hypothetical protein
MLALWPDWRMERLWGGGSHGSGGSPNKLLADWMSKHDTTTKHTNISNRCFFKKTRNLVGWTHPITSSAGAYSMSRKPGPEQKPEPSIAREGTEATPLFGKLHFVPCQSCRFWAALTLRAHRIGRGLNCLMMKREQGWRQRACRWSRIIV